MKICFVSYWGLLEGLSKATVIPHVKILSRLDQVDQVFLMTIERNAKPEVDVFKEECIEHVMVFSSVSIRKKLFDQKKAERALREIFESNKIDLIIARSVHAAWLCMHVAKSFDIPFVVESFEPHSQYMIEDGIWNRNGLRVHLLSRSEKAQKQFALGLYTVTEKYRQRLIQEGVSPKKVHTVPCTADPDLFIFQSDVRQRIRSDLKIEKNTVVGIHTGKWGGIYFDQEALDIFHTVKKALNRRGKQFFLLVLSPDQHVWKRELLNAGMNENEFHTDFVAQEQVASYCSAADFAFSLHRPRPSKLAISPIKNAEFWLTGLPVIIPEGIGDDADLVKEHRLGIRLSSLLTLSDVQVELLLELLKNDRVKGQIRSWARDHRTYERVRTAYSDLLGLL